MRQSFYLVIVLAVLWCMQSKAQTLVAWYPLNGNANDVSGNNLNGIIQGSPVFTNDRNGNASSALQFSGSTSERIEISDNALLHPASVSISCWIKFNGNSGIQTLVDKPLSPCTNDSWHFGSLDNQFSTWISNSTSCGDLSQATTALTTGQWLYYVMTADDAANELKIYVDGLLRSTAPFTGSIPFDNNPMLLGAALENGGLAFPLVGVLDEVKIYNGVLSASQIANTYFGEVAAANLPGSGKAVVLNGIDNNVDLGTFFTYQNFTIDMWLKPGSSQMTFADIVDNNHSGSNINWVCQLINGSPVPDSYVFGINGTGAEFTLTPNVWQQLTLVKSTTAIEAYVNGVLSQSVPYSAGPVNYSNNYLRLGRWGGGSRYWNGTIDEVRIWDTPLSQTQIRDRMCHSITNTDPLYSNLVAYYNFDESSGSSVYDKSGNSNYGVLANYPARTTSGAAIGNASVHDYTSSIKTVTIAHSSGENFTVTSSAGNPDGIQVYRTDAGPNTLNGVQQLVGNDKYFGVFQVGGAAPQYTAVYNYTGNPEVTAGNESSLALYKRTNNAETSWTNSAATLDISNNTLSVSGESTEYILGLNTVILPVKLISFAGQSANNGNLLNWVTANEINFRRFEVERSGDAVTFSKIGMVSSAGLTAYQYLDAAVNSGINYYRLKMIDNDGKYSYSTTIRIMGAQVKNLFCINVNPVTNGMLSVSSDGGNVSVLNASGSLLMKQTVAAGNTRLNIETLPAGVYIIRYTSHKGTVSSTRFLKER